MDDNAIVNSVKKIHSEFFECGVFVLSAIITATVAAGCAALTNYPHRMAPIRRQFETGRALYAAGSLSEAVRRPADRLCEVLERGMMLHSVGRHDASIKSFFEAEQVVAEFDNRALISARGVTSDIMTLVLNERSAPYRGEGVERVLINTYLALDHMMTGDLTGSRVEVRKAYQRQQQETDRYARALQFASSESLNLDSVMRDAGNRFGSSHRAVPPAENAYRNAFMYYLSSIVYELNGELNDAYIDCKHAIELRPNATCIRRDLIRFAGYLGFDDELGEWKERFGDMTVPPAEYGSILVVFEEGMIPVKEERKLPIPTEFGILFMAFPAYRPSVGPVPTMDVSVDGMLLGRTQIMADIEGMSARNLDDKMPVLVAKHMVRSAVKGVAAKQVYDDDRDAGILLSTVGTLITEQADLRGWVTLPRDIQVTRTWVRPGRRSAVLSISGAPLSDSRKVNVQVETHRTTVVNARFTGRHLYVSVSRPLG